MCLFLSCLFCSELLCNSNCLFEPTHPLFCEACVCVCVYFAERERRKSQQIFYPAMFSYLLLTILTGCVLQILPRGKDRFENKALSKLKKKWPSTWVGKKNSNTEKKPLRVPMQHCFLFKVLTALAIREYDDRRHTPIKPNIKVIWGNLEFCNKEIMLNMLHILPTWLLQCEIKTVCGSGSLTDIGLIWFELFENDQIKLTDFFSHFSPGQYQVAGLKRNGSTLSFDVVYTHVFVFVCVCVCEMIIRPQWRLLWCVFLLRHGDMLFLFPSAASSSSGEVMDTALPHTSSSLPFFSSSSTSSTAIPRSSSAPQIQEDEIDQYLTKQDGKIYRNRDPQL